MLETTASASAHCFEPLSPVSFLLRAGRVYADRLAVIDGARQFTYGEFLERSLRMSGALRTLGVGEGDRVAVLAPNTHVMLEAHFGVPFAGAVLVALNYRLNAAELAWIVEHSGARVLIVDAEYAALAQELCSKLQNPPTLVPADDAYEKLLASADPQAVPCGDELGLLAINYTSGTTGKPKGVMYHHRGAYLQSLAMALQMQLDNQSVHLWTLPMFHCNGWSFPWAVTIGGGVHLCLRKPEPGAIWRHLRESGVTHFNAAPTVITMLAWHADARASGLLRPVRIGTGGSPPTPALLQRMSELGMQVTHLYGLTEVYGPAVICDWRPEWDALPIEKQAVLKSRQGVANVIAQPVRVLSQSGADEPADGCTLGEIALRGNNVMLGYYRDPEATGKACPDGWFRTGDLGVMHGDGYVELRDRSKDIIISGGENIASVEVEQALAAHPAVLEAAVVAAPDAKWGEVPIAFVALKPGMTVEEAALIAHLRTILAGYKIPRRIVFEELAKTSTGKVQKYLMREQARGVWPG
jgi:fatty-acyl-CoA synthase